MLLNRNGVSTLGAVCCLCAVCCGVPVSLQLLCCGARVSGLCICAVAPPEPNRSPVRRRPVGVGHVLRVLLAADTDVSRWCALASDSAHMWCCSRQCGHTWRSRQRGTADTKRRRAAHRYSAISIAMMNWQLAAALPDAAALDFGGGPISSSPCEKEERPTMSMGISSRIERTEESCRMRSGDRGQFLPLRTRVRTACRRHRRPTAHSD